jgi:hypothetical protein
MNHTDINTGHPGETTSAPFGRIVSPAPWTADVLCGQSSYDSINSDFQTGVYLDGQVLGYKNSAQIQRHSIGFGWGKQSPGAAQLALALLAEVVTPKEALDLHFRFTAEVIARLPEGRPALCLSRQEIVSWVVSVRREQ